MPQFLFSMTENSPYCNTVAFYAERICKQCCLHWPAQSYPTFKHLFFGAFWQFLVITDLKATERPKNTASMRTYLTSVREVKIEISFFFYFHLFILHEKMKRFINSRWKCDVASDRAQNVRLFTILFHAIQVLKMLEKFLSRYSRNNKMEKTIFHF